MYSINSINSGVTRELPGNCPYQVKVDIIQEYINGWWAPSKDIVYSMDNNLRKQLSTIALEIFKNYASGGLCGLVGYVRRPLPASITYWANSEVVDECLDELKDTCLNRIQEQFDREKSILTTLQVRRFEANREAYKEHYAAMYEQHTASGDSFSMLGDAVESFVEQKIEELMPGRGASLKGPNRQDILGIVRMKNDPAGYQTSEALKIMAEVRSYYDCK